MNHESQSCPNCDSGKFERSYVIKGFSYCLCQSCGMLYLHDTNGSSKSGNGQYSNDYYEKTLKENLSGYMDYGAQSAPLRRNFRNLLFHITRHISLDSQRSVLDIGCAYGFFLDEVRKLGASVHGVDVSKSAIQWMEKNLNINGTVGQSSDAPETLYDLVSAIEVIEHVRDLHSFLDDLYDRLKEDGLLVIATGAHDTLVARLLGRKWWYLNPPDHCSIFSRPALQKIISQKGLQVIEHVIIPFHWAGMNNIMLKVARTLDSQWLGRLAAKLPALAVPVYHFSSQLLIARK